MYNYYHFLQLDFLSLWWQRAPWTRLYFPMQIPNGHDIELYVMWSREISQNSNMWHFQFSIWLKCSFGEVQFAEKPSWIGPVVPKLQAIEGSQNNRKQKKSIPFSDYISHNQRSRLTTDSTRSQHMITYRCSTVNSTCLNAHSGKILRRALLISKGPASMASKNFECCHCNVKGLFPDFIHHLSMLSISRYLVRF